MIGKPNPKVFIGSTKNDLIDYRSIAEITLRRMGFDTIIMEDFTSETVNPLDMCLRKVDDADIYIGIFAYRYGFIPEGESKSITQLEYERARGTGIPCLCFIVDPEIAWIPNHISEDNPQGNFDSYRKLLDFKEELMKNRAVTFFKSPQHLATEIAVTMYELKRQKWNYVSVVKDYREAYIETTSYALANNIKHVREILYYSTRISPVMNELLLAKGVKIELLIQHPKSSIAKQRSEEAIIHYQSLVKKYKEDLTVKLYTERASLKATSLDDKLLVMSWYTDFVDKNEEPKQVEDHPHLMVYSMSPIYSNSKEMFNKVFNRLSNHEKTINIEDY